MPDIAYFDNPSLAINNIRMLVESAGLEFNKTVSSDDLDDLVRMQIRRIDGSINVTFAVDHDKVRALIDEHKPYDARTVARVLEILNERTKVVGTAPALRYEIEKIYNLVGELPNQ